jgi:hypothetical protein
MHTSQHSVRYRFEGFIEDQAFLPLYDMALPFPVSNLDRRHKGRLIEERHLADGGGGRGWGRNQSIRRREAWSSINHSFLSTSKYLSLFTDFPGPTNFFLCFLFIFIDALYDYRRLHCCKSGFMESGSRSLKQETFGFFLFSFSPF